MAQILDPLPPEHSGKILCCYVNATSKIQVTRISNIPNWYFERVVFPGQRLVFEVLPEAQMEVHTGMMASAIISDTIPCNTLIIHEPSNDETEENSSPSINSGNGNPIKSENNKKILDTTKSLQKCPVSVKLID
ncbi:MAG: DUF1830 domain-containing protein [Dolichospermum sp. JUN01]|jgi:hypothetical protein|nr:DUF1830 domain-containing protein [Dolichospermum sp. JUN01]MBS9388971.1 DUF1830 domain-containing protein [Dolichospermum sp. WA123]MBS9393583.1 DUF1830 domain-containing protein [Dolichospermum sp. OL01]MCO5797217.1 DUF1830 domain-containing protein [Dolichospermum sp. OL03]MCS6283690.1 DUF1830 domain-containing protein [Dolichospermum sp.]QSV58754.1 MAG: DUF1830 domain-containing protein [Dolichospermum sp. LBC05a]